MSTQGTKENEDAISELLQRLGKRRHDELSSFLPEHEDELQKLPQILKIRMNALKEVNPEKFSDCPELALSTLAANDLIKRFPNGSEKLSADDIKKAHDKYHIVRADDVNPYLVTNIYFSYFADIKNGAINQEGKILNIEKSEVMQTPHDSTENGLPINAQKTVSKFKKTTNIPNHGKSIEID